jgi:hypothetical protein
MTDDEINILVGNKILGKVIKAGMYFLTTWPRQGPTKRRRESNDKGGENRMSKRKQTSLGKGGTEKATQQMEVETILENEEHEERRDGVAKNTEWKDPSAEHMKDKSTRSDGSAIPYHLWNDGIADKLGELWNSDEYKNPPSSKKKDDSPGGKAALTKPRLDFADPLDRLKLSHMLRTLRTAAAMYWKKLVKKCFLNWFNKHGSSHKDHVAIKEAGEAAVAKAAETIWWEWKSGSTIFFWRWPPDYQDVVREGLSPMFDSEPSTNRDCHPPYDDDKIKRWLKRSQTRTL